MIFRRWLLGGSSALIAASQQRPANASSAPLNLLLEGDSISAGWGAPSGRGLDAHLLVLLGKDTSIHNIAQGGRPVSDCLRLYPQLVTPRYDAAAEHNVIVFHAGDNDLLQGRDAAQTYTAYVAAARSQGWKLVVSTELRRADFLPSRSTELELYNNHLRQNKAGADAVVDFDTDPRMTDMLYRRDPTLFAHDGVHPSEGGYVALAVMIAPAVRRVSGR